MKLFYLERIEDESGVSGTGKVAQGVVFDDGVCALRWLTETSSTAIYSNIEDLEKIHGHHGKTKIVFDEYYEAVRPYLDLFKDFVKKANDRAKRLKS